MHPRILLVCSCAVICFQVFSCKQAPPEPPPPPPPTSYVQTIFLDVVDTTLTDVWIRLHFADTIQTRSFTLLRGTQVLSHVAVAPRDTIIRDDSLLQGHAYSYKAVRMQAGVVVDSTSLPVSTMALTNDEYSFRFDTLGYGNASQLLDVSIISENDVWAVGEVYIQDSTGQIDPHAYNLARWDGTRWKLQRIMFPVCPLPSTAPIPARAIHAFASDDTWITSSGTVARWDGNRFSTMCIPGDVLVGRVNEIWGESGNNVFVAGDLGSLAHFNNGTWSRIESGTQLHIQDIWGAKDRVTGAQTILYIASNKYSNDGWGLYEIRGSQAFPLSGDGLSWSLSSVWFVPNRWYGIVGDGAYLSDTLPNRWTRTFSLPSLYKQHVRGENLNRIAIAGDFGLLVTYNGARWRNHTDRTGMSDGSFYGVDTKGNTLVAVGHVGNKAIAVIGKNH